MDWVVPFWEPETGLLALAPRRRRRRDTKVRSLIAVLECYGHPARLLGELLLSSAGSEGEDAGFLAEARELPTFAAPNAERFSVVLVPQDELGRVVGVSRTIELDAHAPRQNRYAEECFGLLMDGADYEPLPIEKALIDREFADLEPVEFEQVKAVYGRGGGALVTRRYGRNDGSYGPAEWAPAPASIVAATVHCGCVEEPSDDPWSGEYLQIQLALGRTSEQSREDAEWLAGFIRFAEIHYAQPERLTPAGADRPNVFEDVVDGGREMIWKIRREFRDLAHLDRAVVYTDSTLPLIDLETGYQGSALAYAFIGDEALLDIETSRLVETEERVVKLGDRLLPEELLGDIELASPKALNGPLAREAYRRIATAILRDRQETVSQRDRAVDDYVAALGQIGLEWTEADQILEHADLAMALLWPSAHQTLRRDLESVPLDGSIRTVLDLVLAVARANHAVRDAPEQPSVDEWIHSLCDSVSRDPTALVTLYATLWAVFRRDSLWLDLLAVLRLPPRLPLPDRSASELGRLLDLLRDEDLQHALADLGDGAGSTEFVEPTDLDEAFAILDEADRRLTAFQRNLSHLTVRPESARNLKGAIEQILGGPTPEPGRLDQAAAALSRAWRACQRARNEEIAGVPLELRHLKIIEVGAAESVCEAWRSAPKGFKSLVREAARRLDDSLATLVTALHQLADALVLRREEIEPNAIEQLLREALNRGEAEGRLGRAQKDAILQALPALREQAEARRGDRLTPSLTRKLGHLIDSVEYLTTR